jgi:hypothetical protein
MLPQPRQCALRTQRRLPMFIIYLVSNGRQPLGATPQCYRIDEVFLQTGVALWADGRSPAMALP